MSEKPENVRAQLSEALAALDNLRSRCNRLLAENRILGVRHEEHLRLIRKLSVETVDRQWANEMRSQVATLIAEVGTLRSTIVERIRDEQAESNERKIIVEVPSPGKGAD